MAHMYYGRKIYNNAVIGFLAGIKARHWILQSRYKNLRDIRTVKQRNENMNKLLIQGSLQALILQSRSYLRNIKSARPS